MRAYDPTCEGECVAPSQKRTRDADVETSGPDVLTPILTVRSTTTPRTDQCTSRNRPPHVNERTTWARCRAMEQQPHDHSASTWRSAPRNVATTRLDQMESELQHVSSELQPAGTPAGMLCPRPKMERPRSTTWRTARRNRPVRRLPTCWPHPATLLPAAATSRTPQFNVDSFHINQETL
jgi:hypothetical protein